MYIYLGIDGRVLESELKPYFFKVAFEVDENLRNVEREACKTLLSTYTGLIPMAGMASSKQLFEEIVRLSFIGALSKVVNNEYISDFNVIFPDDA